MTGPESLSPGADVALQLRAGQSQVYELPGMGSAGYRWIPELDVTDVVEVTRQPTSPPAEPRRMAGRAAAEQLVVSALQPGSAVIDFAQRRPWETDVSPRATVRVRVEVTAPTG